MRHFFARALRHPVSALGVALTTASALLFLALFALHVLGFLQNPYIGILVFILIPAVFVVGLLLIPLGDRLQRRRVAAGVPERPWPRIDLNDSAQRRMVLLVGVLTVVNILILSMASYGAVEYSESQAFCGQLCHTVMEPEFVAHGDGLHGRVHCVQCHVGPGAGGFVSAKLNGTRQLWLATTGTYSRPIPTPVTTLPDVRDTCEQCHRPDRFVGDKLDVIYDHANDAANKETKTTVRLKVGGPVSGTGSGTGIHWHMNRANEIEYVALDDKRENIAYVRVATPDGRVREFFGDGVKAGDISGKPRRRMDCLDCHNRPAHSFGTSAARAVDAALGQGLISPKIPFIRREAVRVLGGSYATQELGLEAIDRELRKGVSANEPRTFEEADLRRAIEVTQRIYRDNVFPSMKVGWGTHPNQLGHTDSNGCFRCHDDSHKTAQGVAISQDCELCHTIE
jgi:NapC/NirT cytochrome c family protein